MKTGKLITWRKLPYKGSKEDAKLVFNQANFLIQSKLTTAPCVQPHSRWKVVCLMCSLKPFLGMFQASWQPAFQRADTLGSRASLSRAPFMQLLQLRLQLLLHHLHLFDQWEWIRTFFWCVCVLTFVMFFLGNNQVLWVNPGEVNWKRTQRLL